MTRGACAIVLDDKRALISFARIRRTKASFLLESEILLPSRDSDILSFLQDNLEVLEQKIQETEQCYSLKVEKIFLELPDSLSWKKIVEETVLLKTRKNITSSDISSAKRYYENKFLDWDDFCVHNITINYGIEGIDYISAPLGLKTKKIRMRSLLIWIKDKLYRDTEDIFANLNRDFGGFVASVIGIFSAAFSQEKKTQSLVSQAAVSIDYTGSQFIVKRRDDFLFSERFNFSLKKIIKELAERYDLCFSLAEEVFSRYISFKEALPFKEITLKKEQGYVNIDNQSLNCFIKNYIRGEIIHILEKLREQIGNEACIISFLGRFNTKEGFYDFLKSFVPSSLKATILESAMSHSFGCLDYGMSRFLETDHEESKTFFQNIVKIYKEYF